MNWRFVLLASAMLSLAAPLAARADERPIAQMRWRALGPALPVGRATSVVGSNVHALLYYAGTADGGVWKSLDGGTSWQNVSDFIHLGSVGAIGVNPNDDADVWVGAGETNPRNDVIPESGLYHSTNGGRSWQSVAFPTAPGISRILVDPSDPKHIIVGVLGDVFAPSTQRGVYVSFDGGASFSKTLYLSDQSGASDMAMDPKNPNVIYAGMWHVLRRPWAITSGGTGDDGLFRSSDGGRTWKEVTGNGFPTPPIGRIGVAIAPSDPSRIYALVESAAGILWRSDDSGVTWKIVSKDSLANQRPFYFSHVRVSPTDPATVYGVSILLATFVQRRGKVRPLGLWRASRPPRHVDIVGRQTDGARRRRRHRDLDQRRRDLGELAELRDRPDLSRRPFEHDTVSGLRRLAGQQRLLRPRLQRQY